MKASSSIGLLVTVLVVGGVGAQATGLLNTSSGGYLVCVNSTTKIVTHPGTTTCPKGSKKLILGEQGATGLTGATGLSGKDGTDGKDGKTLWNGVLDPENSWGAPGDMFINSVTKTLFGPKNLDGTWPAGVSMVGPAGAQGPIGLTGAQGPGGASGGSGPAGAAGAAGANGTNATIAITELSVCDGPDAGTVADELCKIGMTGPGGGIIFFVDYYDRYTGFNYLEAAPDDLPGVYAWSNDTTTSVTGAAGWVARAVGRGQANTTAIITAYPISGAAVAADAYSSPSYNSVVKSDWFLGSSGEMKLMYDNLQGFGDFLESIYWTSSERLANVAWFQAFSLGIQESEVKSKLAAVRPVRAF